MKFDSGKFSNKVSIASQGPTIIDFAEIVNPQDWYLIVETPYCLVNFQGFVWHIWTKPSGIKLLTYDG